MTLPAGQSLLIRMIDSVDSKKNNVGDAFHASLETDLLINGVLVARRGADVYGKLDYVKEAGHFSGSAELELQLTSLVVDGQTYPLVSDYTLKEGPRRRYREESRRWCGTRRHWRNCRRRIGRGHRRGCGRRGGRRSAGVYARQRGEGAKRDAAGVPATATRNRERHSSLGRGERGPPVWSDRRRCDDFRTAFPWTKSGGLRIKGGPRRTHCGTVSRSILAL